MNIMEKNFTKIINKKETLKHLDFIVNHCSGKMTDKPTMVLSSEDSLSLTLDMAEGTQAVQYAREKAAEKARDKYVPNQGIVYE